MISQDQLVAMQNKWNINYYPSYREPECNNCGKKIRKMWHLWLRHNGYMKEAHVCRRCGERYGLIV